MEPVIFIDENNSTNSFKLLPWLIHIFTASAAIFGVWSLMLIHEGNYQKAFITMTAALIIDCVDGTLARISKVKNKLPYFDGALLDNIVDYLTYVIVPCFFLYIHPDIISKDYRLLPITAIILSSAYQFCHTNAKTDDHFFRGFPSYWNFVVFYMFFCDFSASTNTIIIYALAVMSFVPIKYIYLSRMHFVTNNKILKYSIFLTTIIYSWVSIMLLIQFPKPEKIYIIMSFWYIIFYFLISLYRTLKPLK